MNTVNTLKPVFFWVWCSDTMFWEHGVRSGISIAVLLLHFL